MKQNFLADNRLDENTEEHHTVSQDIRPLSDKEFTD
jgi:hypothetical protein